MNLDIQSEIPIKKRDYEVTWKIDHLSRLAIQLPYVGTEDVLLAILSAIHPAGSPISMEADEAWISERRVAKATGRKLAQRDQTEPVLQKASTPVIARSRQDGDVAIPRELLPSYASRPIGSQPISLRDIKDDEFVSLGGVAYIFRSQDTKQLAILFSKVPTREWYGTFALSTDFVPFMARQGAESALQLEQYVLESMRDETVFFYSKNHRHVEIMAKEMGNLLEQVQNAVERLETK